MARSCTTLKMSGKSAKLSKGKCLKPCPFLIKELGLHWSKQRRKSHTVFRFVHSWDGIQQKKLKGTRTTRVLSIHRMIRLCHLDEPSQRQYILVRGCSKNPSDWLNFVTCILLCREAMRETIGQLFHWLWWVIFVHLPGSGLKIFAGFSWGEFMWLMSAPTCCTRFQPKAMSKLGRVVVRSCDLPPIHPASKHLKLGGEKSQQYTAV